jgi:hypothetical protein
MDFTSLLGINQGASIRPGLPPANDNDFGERVEEAQTGETAWVHTGAAPF